MYSLHEGVPGIAGKDIDDKEKLRKMFSTEDGATQGAFPSD
jgi:hypothetical protein